MISQKKGEMNITMQQLVFYILFAAFVVGMIFLMRHLGCIFGVRGLGC